MVAIAQHMCSSKYSTLCMCTIMAKVTGHGIMPYLFLSGHHQVIKNFVIHFVMNCSFHLDYCIGMEKKILKFQLNYLFWLGVVNLRSIVHNESQRLSEFKDTKQWLCVRPNYGFIWEKLQYISLLHIYLPMRTNCMPWLDWHLKDGTQLLQDVCNLNVRWWQVLQCGWHSHLLFV